MRRPVRFFVYDIAPDATLWLEDEDGSTSEVLSVRTYDAMGHGRLADRRLSVVVMETGSEQDQAIAPDARAVRAEAR